MTDVRIYIKLMRFVFLEAQEEDHRAYRVCALVTLSIIN